MKFPLPGEASETFICGSGKSELSHCCLQKSHKSRACFVWRPELSILLEQPSLEEASWLAGDLRESFSRNLRETFPKNIREGFPRGEFGKDRASSSPLGARQCSSSSKVGSVINHNVKQIIMRNDSEEWGSPLMLDGGWSNSSFEQLNDNAQW